MQFEEFEEGAGCKFSTGIGFEILIELQGQYI